MTGLPDTSYTAALASGGREFLGWGMDRQLLAGLYDALNVNTRATGQWRKRPPELPAWPRPKSATKPERKKPVTVASLYSQMQRR
ncbi:hypothetical protein FHR83_007107 [Actinoplanes campanulatus]|uniref:Uncharacterized protein n=1 Tax=Actinoplanes campanulatus TaxID=113559 RepID=A0A7W5FI78_9ACTN|nr:hypothetical protein [Actinoplanes campanulatus]MBB3099401.1 hypothetical protein [Actinoplanes campanulatus]